MNVEKIREISELWNQKTSCVFDLKKLETEDLGALLRETFEIFKFYQYKSDVPKEVCRLLLNIEDFLYFGCTFEGRDAPADFYHFQALNEIFYALKNGLFEGCFEYRFKDEEGPFYPLDMNDGLEDFFAPFGKTLLKKCVGLKLI